MKTTKSEINPAFVMPARADGAAFWVPSRTQDICYLVERKNGALHCSCPARVAKCCHVRAVETRIQQDMQAEADRLASLPRALAEVETSEEQKLAQIERDAALPKERVLDRQAPSFGRSFHCPQCHTTTSKLVNGVCVGCYESPVTMAMRRAVGLIDEPCAVCQQAERAAKREQALPADHTPEEFSIFATPTRHKYERVTEDW